MGCVPRSVEEGRGGGVGLSGLNGTSVHAVRPERKRVIGYIIPFRIAHDVWEIPTAHPRRGNQVQWSVERLCSYAKR